MTNILSRKVPLMSRQAWNIVSNPATAGPFINSLKFIKRKWVKRKRRRRRRDKEAEEKKKEKRKDGEEKKRRGR